MEIFECEPEGDWKHKKITGVVELAKRLETSPNLWSTNSKCTVSEGIVKIVIMNLNEHEYTVPRNLQIGKLTILTLEQVKQLAPIDTNLCKFLEENHPGETEIYLNQLFQGALEEYPTQNFWFPTPEDNLDVSKMNQIERRIHDEILKLQEAEKLDPTQSEEEEKSS